jgi:hypothetical protein
MAMKVSIIWIQNIQDDQKFRYGQTLFFKLMNENNKKMIPIMVLMSSTGAKKYEQQIDASMSK